MGLSLYYTAFRKHPISYEEQTAIDDAIGRYSVDDQINGYIQTGRGINWESFGVFETDDETEEGVIFDGSTRLPDITGAATDLALAHWSKLLSEIRGILTGATWDVSVDDHALKWDERINSFRP